MKLEPSIRTELRFVAGGLLIGDALICAVFALLNKFDYTVPLGALWGSVFAWLSIFLLALRVQKVADSEGEEKALAQKRLRSSYWSPPLWWSSFHRASIMSPRWFRFWCRSRC